jgi:hypothetical protein
MGNRKPPQPLSMFLWIALVAAQTVTEQRPRFNFFVNMQGRRPFDVIPSSEQVTFTWVWDTCAGALNANGEIAQDARQVDGVCVDQRQERLQDADGLTVFPNGFTSFSLGNSENNIDLRPQVFAIDVDYQQCRVCGCNTSIHTFFVLCSQWLLYSIPAFY